MELSNLVEARGATDIAENIRGAQDTIDKNEEGACRFPARSNIEL